MPVGSGGTPTPTPEPMGATRLRLPTTVTVARGPDIRAATAIAKLFAFPDPDHSQFPVGAHAGRLIVQRLARSRGTPPAREYLLWDTVTDKMDLLWRAPAESQDVVAGTDRGWIATTRTGTRAPHSDWEVIIRNGETGELRVIAEVEARAQRLGLGESPIPSIAGGRVAWAELRVGDDGSRRTLIQVYDISAESLATVYELDNMRSEEIRSVSLGGNRIAWIHERSDWRDSQIVVRELSTGVESRFVVQGKPFSGKLSRDGRFFAWDLESKAKFALDIDTGRVDRFASDEGEQVVVTEEGVSWQAGTGPNARGGFYDFGARTVRLTETSGDNASWLLGGGYFFFRESPLDNRGIIIDDQVVFHIVRIVGN
ncbi:MAG: hypothetical protein IH609_17930 [Dehalococcoidia bacterium]|nr:hypothetical protein [Dehalococcoidia bacterium]